MKIWHYLLIVCKHNHTWNIERVLEPFRKFKRYGMTDMHAATARAATGVQEEGLAAFVDIENLVKVPVAEEQASTEPAMRFATRELGEPLQKLLVNQLCVPAP
jgi:hypothetical protein